MKKLYIIRHAKSDWDNANFDDYDRPLSKRGEKNAPFMAKLLKNKEVEPDLIISSPALRAISTAKIFKKELNYKKEITANQYIYEAYINTLQEIIEYVHDSNDIVLLVGHNPGVSALAYTLCGLKESIPTCAIVEIEFNCNSWMDVCKENSTLISYEYPKKYK